MGMEHKVDRLGNEAGSITSGRSNAALRTSSMVYGKNTNSKHHNQSKKNYILDLARKTEYLKYLVMRWKT